MRREGGFTLLELLLVMLLITLILGISVVFIGSSSSTRQLNATARDVSSVIRYARALARTSGENQTVTIDLDAKQFGIDGRKIRTIPPEIDVTVQDSFAGKLQSGKYQILFKAMGTSEGGTIILSSRKRTISIEMDPIVGAVTIKS